MNYVEKARLKVNDKVMVRTAKGDRTVTPKGGVSKVMKSVVELVGETGVVAGVIGINNFPDVNGPRDVPGFEWIEYAVRMDEGTLVSFRFHELVKV
jgi:uncharacterized protein YkvS